MNFGVKKAHKSLLKRLLPLLLVTMMLLPLCMIETAALSKDFEVETDLALAGKVSGAKVDGKLSENFWNDAIWYGVANRQVATTMNNTIDFAVAWDEKNFYVGIKVLDANVVTENLSADIFNNDGIEIFIDPNNEKTPGKYDDKVVHLMYQAADGKWVLWGGADKWSDVAAKHPSTAAAHVLTDDGYTVEASFSFAELGIDYPVDGVVFGLEVTNNDDDNAGSDSAEDRFIQYWNEATDAGSPATWGSVCLYNKAKTLISYPGTPKVDGILDDSEGWIYSSEAIDEANGISYRLASMCDDKNYYIAIDLYGTDLEDAGMNMLFDFDNSKTATGESPKHINDHSFKTNTGRHNQTNGIIKTVRTDDGYTIEIEAPLEALGYKPEYLDTVGIEIEMFKAVADYTKPRLIWNNASTGSLWGSTVGYGSLIFNNINVAGGTNSAPVGNQISSYSIPEGHKLSGKVTVTDPDGDALTYVFDPYNKQAADSMGTFELDETTGEWTYTPPSKTKMANKSVNYYIQVADEEGVTFHQRIEIRIEPTPTYKTYHVDGDTGKDSNDGLTPETALKSIYTAISKVRPGDTVIIHESDVPYGYTEQREHVITTSGLPDAYITFKAAEGEAPVVNSRNAWCIFRIEGSYIIIDGLTVKGQAHEIMSDYASCYESYYKAATGGGAGSAARYNTNGIAVMHVNNSDRIGSKGIDDYKTIHHVEIRNCVTEGIAGVGICAIGCDYITIENNTVYNNSWGDMYGSSGISILNGVDVDDNFDTPKYVIRNNIAAGNRHFVPWVSIKKFSDGNGIIVDSTDNASTSKSLLSKGDKWGVQPFGGRTLVANNLSYLNGGSGIHVFNGDNVDLVNNTIFSNAMTPYLHGWSDFFSNSANNVTMYNNIVYAHTGTPAQISSSSSLNVFYDNNLFYNYSSVNNLGKIIKGGNGSTGTIPGENNIYGKDPLFENVYEVNFDTGLPYPDSWSADMKTTAKDGGYYIGANYDVTLLDYDFNLKAGSPALNSGDPEWSKKLGNTDNRMGIFGTIGSPLMPVKVSDAVPNTDMYRGESPKIEAYVNNDPQPENDPKPADDPKPSDDPKSDTTAANGEPDTETSEGDVAAQPGDGESDGFPIAVPIVAAVVVAIGAVIAAVMGKKNKASK